MDTTVQYDCHNFPRPIRKSQSRSLAYVACVVADVGRPGPVGRPGVSGWSGHTVYSGSLPRLEGAPGSSGHTPCHRQVALRKEGRALPSLTTATEANPYLFVLMLSELVKFFSENKMKVSVTKLIMFHYPFKASEKTKLVFKINAKSWDGIY